ncbi:MAG: MBL fold metallo-hydrolase [Tissierellia bacterium]|jgi:metallo-beta-lactamase family protein|nr:MBL fold metallo-hydrolase [Tissierellia bacterium]MDD3750852.1 MBL fold metallo-hydrolase [Tissierellia bacterium]
MKIRFLGAVNGVTGSNHLIQTRDKNIMLDCGMYQGKDEELNEEEFAVAPADIDCLLLSHSHIDHSGRIPLLVKKGFKGVIYCSKPTYDLCEIMLLDSAHIQETEAQWKNNKAKRSGKKFVEPLYTQEDAIESLQYFKPVLYDQIINIDENTTVKFNDAGHILGSSIIEMWLKDEDDTIKLVYSGDLGMREKPILKDPALIDRADYLIMEATYGNRIHGNIEQRTEELIKIILKTAKRGGSVIIPSFAVGRTQELIYELNKYYDSHLNEIGTEENELRNIPVFIDSPLAIKATEIFKRNSHAFDKEAKDYLMKGDNPLDFENLHFTLSADESKQLNFSTEPKIIISASGMCEAGRIRHHLKHNLWRKEASIVFVGYQAEGTLGRRLLDGEKNVKLFGEDIKVNAEIYNIEGFSGHADKPSLLNWIGGFNEKPGNIFIVHGEKESKEAFAMEVKERFGINSIIPQYNVVYDIKKRNLINEVVLKDEKQKVKDKQIQELLKEVDELRKAFENALSKTKGCLRLEDVDTDKFENINNNIKSLENEIMNLTMISAK